MPDADALVRAATDRIVERLAHARGPASSLCLSGGSTPRRIYERLADREIDWSRVHLFWGDERLVGPDHPDSNDGMARRALVDRVPIPPGNVHPIHTSGRSAADAASAYDAVLRAFHGSHRASPAEPLFDVALLGLGQDGHTASLFPGSPALDETESWAAAVDEAGQPPFVPRVTLTRPALAASRETIFLVTGAAKHGPLAAVGRGDRLPAAMVADDGPNTVWLVDRDAAAGAAA